MGNLIPMTIKYNVVSKASLKQQLKGKYVNI